MDIVLIILGFIALLVGLAGCILPIIPGPPIAWLAILAASFMSNSALSGGLIVKLAIAVGVVTVLDYIVPVWGTKKFGGSKKGVWGSIIGLIIGLFFGPIGIIAGPFLGALVGEYMAGKESDKAFKAAFGSFLGFVGGVLLKVIVVGFIAFYFIKDIF